MKERKIRSYKSSTHFNLHLARFWKKCRSRMLRAIVSPVPLCLPNCGFPLCLPYLYHCVSHLPLCLPNLYQCVAARPMCLPNRAIVSPNRPMCLPTSQPIQCVCDFSPSFWSTRARARTDLRLCLRSVLPPSPRVQQSTYCPQNMKYYHTSFLLCNTFIAFLMPNINIKIIYMYMYFLKIIFAVFLKRILFYITSFCLKHL